MAEEELAARMAALDAQIDEAQRKLASLRHVGERHFIDDAPVAPELAQALHDVVEAGERYRHSRAAIRATPGQPDTPLVELEKRIARLRRLTENPHKTEQHFIDG
jgi:hypothetical protein